MKSYEEAVKEEMGIIDDTPDELTVPPAARSRVVEEPEEVENDEFLEQIEAEYEPPEEEEETPEDLPIAKTYSRDEVSKITKQRIKNYNKKLEQMSKYKEALDTLGDLTGLDINQLTTKLLSMSVDEQAKLLNLPVEQVRSSVEQRKQSRLTKRQSTEAQRKLSYLDLVDKEGYEDLPILREDVEDMLDAQPSLTYEQAYKLVKSEVGSQVVQPKAKPKKQPGRVVSQSRVSSSRARNTKISPAIRDAAQKAGMDPREYVAYSKMRNIDDYRKYNKK